MTLAEILQYDEATLRPLLIGQTLRNSDTGYAWTLQNIRWTKTSVLLDCVEHPEVVIRMLDGTPCPVSRSSLDVNYDIRRLRLNDWVAYLNRRVIDFDLLDILR